ncbi:hypothetical protein MVES1_002753 [Malassezia vespertilionis]|uniref:Glucosidase 2 subunit beta n=1 Tax=Malassezia vespertilionis TaxID=2020962 RepID=A0A2N1JAQ6_9BASI|nr:uncharacterized protein MVES1_002753 [Malassezia vespertilionis]PKI83627.1 hypothetical protein MVES_002601 [Malassezia vespertilionis]WFD07389.1 hypothetical protein MVES1_002753 [Malassezia vespertilionis]
MLARAAVDICGVAPDQAVLYTPLPSSLRDAVPMWKCIGTDQIIPLDRINDDYCDCDDGSDEPGTSACPNGWFYCHNEGHIPSYIRSSQVNDGVCEPACCDGSDETDGKTVCPNVCAAMNKEMQARLANERKVHRRGAKVRQGYVGKFVKDKAATTAECARIGTELRAAELNQHALREAMESAEELSSGREQRKRASPLYESIETRNEAIAALRDNVDAVAGELMAVGRMLERVIKDEKELEGVQSAYKIWLGRTFDGDDERERSLQEKVDIMLQKLEFSREDLTTLVEQDTLALLDGAPNLGSNATEPQSPMLDIAAYLPDTAVPLYRRIVAWILDMLLKLGLISHAQVPDYSGGLRAARDAHEKSQQHTRDLRVALDDQEVRLRKLDTHVGRDGEFYALHGECIKTDTGDYTYELCFGESTAQISNNDQYTFNLGRFSGFDTAYPLDDNRRYLTLFYKDGQSCWNGPPRSTKVTLECGERNELVDVYEAEKCAYTMHAKTPAVCFPKPPADGVVHNEL